MNRFRGAVSFARSISLSRVSQVDLAVRVLPGRQSVRQIQIAVMSVQSGTSPAFAIMFREYFRPDGSLYPRRGEFPDR